MLPAHARLTRRPEFASTIKRGRRAGRSRLVVHLDLTRPGGVPEHASPRAGFVVSKAVGNAVVRHRVTRRLRHLVSDRMDQLPAGAALVVRALPPAGRATSAELGADLDSALRAARRPRRQRPAPESAR
ncbi:MULTISPECIES: ribonuclease P protein component [unclassified Pseudonocardia]|uniref:ribonuclease P protein component n=1 Tax=unclassified Pseudonocardia TaxID=2619320 RepID=UPI0001FFE662|nr:MULTISPECIES: ribonuclease P protein component [unclassified Pseudonocardia]ALE75534.1 ribonuclease P [Pseudonocardia sp. EC080625-04]ALL74905.1 ribonuclease P [Pseudonocardia sp. EC080610-09]ALL81927.1 ribonuclease P [Pseudonocardia sp. EC080619-01]